MRRALTLLRLAILLHWGALGACGGSDPTAQDPGLPGGRPPTPMAPANAVGGFFIELPPATLQPGEEQTPCYLFPVQLSGPSRLISASVLTTQIGLHHGNITSRARTGDGVRTCEAGSTEDLALEISRGGTVLFASSTQVRGTEWQRFPDGMAVALPEDQEIVARMHYLNAGTTPITISARYQWFTIAQSDLKQELTPFAWDYLQFHIPPHSNQYTVRADCELSRPMFMVQALPHMHGLGRRFTIRLNGGPLDGYLALDNTSYGTRGDTDIRMFDPPIDLTQGGQGTGAGWSCTWDNPSDTVITEGLGANEMCILFGFGYPRQNTLSAAASEKADCFTLAMSPQNP